MESVHFSHFENTDQLLTRFTRDLRVLGLEFYDILKDAVSVEPRVVAGQFGLSSAKQAYMLTTMETRHFETLGQNGGLPYEAVFTNKMLASISHPENRKAEFNEAAVVAAGGERFGSRKVSWRMRELMWRRDHWFLCREVLRADLDLGMVMFGLPDQAEGIVKVSCNELYGLVLDSMGQLRLPQSVPGQLATVFADANSLEQITLTFRMVAGAASTTRTSR